MARVCADEPILSLTRPARLGSGERPFCLQVRRYRRLPRTPERKRVPVCAALCGGIM